MCKSHLLRNFILTPSAVLTPWHWLLSPEFPWGTYFLPDTQNCGLHMRREWRECFLRHRGLAIPTCIKARAWCTWHDACRGRLPAVFFEVSGGENVPSITGGCTTRNFCVSGKRPMAACLLAGSNNMGSSAVVCHPACTTAADKELIRANKDRALAPLPHKLFPA